MRRPLRRQKRWFHAVAMTCLSGFALCGCIRGNRDLSKLQENAEREALEAERHVAERKRHDSVSPTERDQIEQKSTERSVASSSRVKEEEQPTLAQSASDDPWNQDISERRNSFDQSREELSSDSETDEGVIRTVSDTSEDTSGVEEASSEEQSDAMPTELFNEQDSLASDTQKESVSDSNEEGVIRIQRKNPETSSRSKSANTLATAKSGQASYRSSQEHPWARKAPAMAQSEEVTQDFETSKPSQQRDSVKSYGVDEESTSVVFKDTDSQLDQSTAQSETKARIRVLLTQAESLVKKGEFRSAYRAAQVAQRMAESNDVYFAAGERQPADVVRNILRQVRETDSQVAASRQQIAQKPVSKPAAKEDSPESSANNRSKVSKLPDTWAFAEWRNEEEWKNAPPKAPEPAVAMQNDSLAKQSRSEMKIVPGQRRNEVAKAFPGSSEWKPNAEKTVAQSSATSADNRSEVVPAHMPVEGVSGIGRDQMTAKPSGQLLVPRPFPKPNLDELSADDTTDSSELASNSNWRDVNLAEAGTGRMPLLVAPMPPQETTEEVLADLPEETLAIEEDDLEKSSPESRLWMLLAAAAGAMALLFVRRRPSSVRTESKNS